MIVTITTAAKANITPPQPSSLSGMPPICAQLPVAAGRRADFADFALCRRGVGREHGALGPFSSHPARRYLRLVPCPFDPMLASSGPLPADGDPRWAYEPKWDGFRALVHINSRVTVWSRRGADLTDRFPELAGLSASVPADTVLDGELVVLDLSGRPNFGAIRRRGLLGQVEAPATFVVFDVVRLGGRDLLAQRFRARRVALEHLCLSDGACVTTPSHEGDGVALFEATREQGLEGVVAKRLDSPYRPGSGRSSG